MLFFCRLCDVCGSNLPWRCLMLDEAVIDGKVAGDGIKKFEWLCAAGEFEQKSCNQVSVYLSQA